MTDKEILSYLSSEAADEVCASRIYIEMWENSANLVDTLLYLSDFVRKHIQSNDFNFTQFIQMCKLKVDKYISTTLKRSNSKYKKPMLQSNDATRYSVAYMLAKFIIKFVNKTENLNITYKIKI